MQQSRLQAETQELSQTKRAHRGDGDGGKGPSKPRVNQLEKENSQRRQASDQREGRKPRGHRDLTSGTESKEDESRLRPLLGPAKPALQPELTMTSRGANNLEKYAVLEWSKFKSKLNKRILCTHDAPDVRWLQTCIHSHTSVM